MRVHPVTGEYKLHTGADYSAPDGIPILVAEDGTVTHASTTGGYGGLIIIEHTIGGQITARMLHLYNQALDAYPDTSRACYSPRPGQKSERPSDEPAASPSTTSSANIPHPNSGKSGRC